MIHSMGGGQGRCQRQFFSVHLNMDTGFMWREEARKEPQSRQRDIHSITYQLESFFLPTYLPTDLPTLRI